VETIRLRTHKNLSNSAEAEVVRISSTARFSKALSLGLGGTLLGFATILIPVAHFVTTWAIPLVSLVIAWHVYRMGPTIARIVGTCPACDATIDTAGGVDAPDLWVRCPGCEEPLHPELIDAE
jgi:hypothetical protein